MVEIANAAERMVGKMKAVGDKIEKKIDAATESLQNVGKLNNVH